MKRLQRGVLISLEGIDGSGKSTLARSLEITLKQLGLPVVLTKEPGATPLGKEIRHVVHQAQYKISPLAETLLFAADRAQHIEEVVKPALSRGDLVISDRMDDSTRAYQGFARGIDRNRLEALIGWVMQSIKPDVTLYLALDIDTACKRIAERKNLLTRIEAEDRSFHANLIHGFETIFAQRDNVIRIDATLPLERVAECATNELLHWLTYKKLLYD